MVSVNIPVDAIENGKGALGKVLGGGDTVEQHGLMFRECLQKVDDRRIPAIDDKRVVPQVDKVLLCQRLDFGKIHHHAVCRIARLRDDVSGKRDFNRITMAVQVSALAFVVRDAMTGIKFEAAGDKHGILWEIRAGNYSIDAIAPVGAPSFGG